MPVAWREKTLKLTPPSTTVAPIGQLLPAGDRDAGGGGAGRVGVERRRRTGRRLDGCLTHGLLSTG